MNYNSNYSTRFSAYLARERSRWGEKFDSSELSHQFVEHFNSGQRIIVQDKWGEIERGYVGVTTGWKPSFLLIHRRSDLGSSTLLNDDYKIIGTVNKFI